MNSEIKICQNCKQNFTIEPEDFEFYKKIDVPTPTFCPECRMVRRMNFRNEHALYKRKCDATGKDIISMFCPESPKKFMNTHIGGRMIGTQEIMGKNSIFQNHFLSNFRNFLSRFRFRILQIPM